MKHVAQGDLRACRVLAHRLAARVQLLARRLLGESEVSHAVALRALLEILRSTASYRQSETIEAWAEPIAIRVALRKPRKRAPRWLRLRPAPAQGSRPAPAQIAPGLAHRLSEYLETLPGPEREVLVLRVMSGCELEQIAELTETPLFAVRSRVIRARARLRREIATRSREAAPSQAQQRWAECMDRLALGESLAHDELAFCESVRGTDANIRIELELLGELGQHTAEPDAQSRELVSAVLQRMAVEAERTDQADVIQLKTPAHGARFWWTFATIAAVAVALAVVLLPPRPNEQRPNAVPVEPAARTQVIYAAGEVRLDGEPIRPESLLLAEGSTLEVARGSACLSMEPGIVICAGEATRLRISRAHGVWRRLDLETGRVAVQLPLQPHDWRLSIVAGAVWATSTGATFALEGDAASLQATVLAGEVAIGTDGGPAASVRAHHRARIGHDRNGVAAVGELEEAEARALLRPAGIWHAPLGATLDLRGLPANAEILIDDRVIGTAPLLTRLPAGPHLLQVGMGSSVIAALQFSAEIGKLTALSFEPASQKPALNPRPPVPASP